MSHLSTESDNAPGLFSKSFEPYILAVLSGQIASFPQTKESVHGK